MAKWGQGDPRWIVEEREDGTNVNNWHWTERDATSLSKGKLRDLLVGIVVENETGHRVISELKQVEDVIKESGAKHKGLIEILSLSEENEVDDTEMNLSFGTSTLLEIQASSPTGWGVRIPTVTLHMTELFDPTVEQLYSIFTVKDEAEKGGTFQMFDGKITGEYVELVDKKIVMKWRHRNWPEEHHATVALNFVPTPGQNGIAVGL
ncbi:activator of 90 kDa heat shock protein ATPase homolog 1 [Prionailurus iriomotensis]